MPRTELSERDRFRLVLHLAEQLSGLNVVEIEWTLGEVRRLAGIACTLDAKGPDFQRQVAAFEEKFGDDFRPRYEG
jgi:hypothetical protein